LSIEEPVRLPLTVRVPKMRSRLLTEMGSKATPTTTMWPLGSSPGMSALIDAPFEAVAMTAAAPPSFCSASPGSSLELSM
jgi:hypothetical protein